MSAKSGSSTQTQPSPEQLRDEWLNRLQRLVETVREWAESLGWSTRIIEKSMQDSEIGPYQAPALLLQEGTTKALLEPVARSAPGTEGIVDLYLMPAYDDMAGLYYYDGGWHLHYMFSGTPTVPTIRDAQAKPLSQEALQEVLDEMKQNAVQDV